MYETIKDSFNIGDTKKIVRRYCTCELCLPSK